MAAKKNATPAGARGVALVDQVIAALEREPKGAKSKAKPSAAAIAKMRLAGGAPLPESLQRFLAHHGPEAQFPGMWEEGERSSLVHLDIASLIRRVYPRDVLRYFDIAPIVDALPGRCHPLEWDTPLRFLYVGEADAWGEYPVLVLQDYDDVLDVVVDYPGLDVHLACAAQVIPRPRYYGGIIENAAYAPMLRATVKRNFAPAPKLAAAYKQYRFAAKFRS